MSELRAGRPEACAELVHAHYQQVYRFLAQLTRDVHRAEDLTQETFAAAWKKLGEFESRSALSTWLHRIAHTKFVDSQRVERRKAAAQKKSCSAARTQWVDPADPVIADDDARRLHQALNTLDDGDRTVLILHYLQGLSYRDMAAVLDEPSGTVKWRTSEALNRLRQALGEEVFDHEARRISS